MKDYKIMDVEFSKDEYLKFSRSLERYHEIFATMWKITKPYFTDQIPTAAVGFDKKGACISFMINPTYWKSIDNYTKEFIICHELSHVALAHGIRSKPYMNYSHDVINSALDLAVNHLLVSRFGFNRFLINDWNKLCWVDTIFKDLVLEEDKSFEYYMSRIHSICKEIQVKVVDHSYLSQFDQNTVEKIKDLSNEINKSLTKEQLEHVKDELQNCRGRSSEESTEFSTLSGDNIKYKTIRKWESVLSKAVYKADHERERTQWIRLNRRLTYFNSDLLLPSEMETVDKEPYKYKIWLFLDYSGSCGSLRIPFLRASNTFSPKKFEVRKFAHTTQVSEFNNNDVNIYGGGTSFACIEDFIQKQIASGKITKYPDFIFHMTDGWGDNVIPQHPERWRVFLTSRNSKACFPTATPIFSLQDFVYMKV